jgi:hypothetical protein
MHVDSPQLLQPDTTLILQIKFFLVGQSWLSSGASCDDPYATHGGDSWDTYSMTHEDKLNQGFSQNPHSPMQSQNFVCHSSFASDLHYLIFFNEIPAKNLSKDRYSMCSIGANGSLLISYLYFPSAFL